MNRVSKNSMNSHEEDLFFFFTMNLSEEWPLSMYRREKQNDYPITLSFVLIVREYSIENKNNSIIKIL